MPQVIFSARSLRDLHAIHKYISDDSARMADHVVDRLIEATTRIERFPLTGRSVPEFDREDIREVIEFSYRIIYRVSPGQISILTIVHGARQLPKRPPTGR